MLSVRTESPCSGLLCMRRHGKGPSDLCLVCNDFPSAGKGDRDASFELSGRLNLQIQETALPGVLILTSDPLLSDKDAAAPAFAGWQSPFGMSE